jgi:hypothetical protein
MRQEIMNMIDFGYGITAHYRKEGALNLIEWFKSK